MSSPEQLSAKARDCIDEAAVAGIVGVSAISAWELALKHAKGKLDLVGGESASAFLERCVALPFMVFLPIDATIALRSALLPRVHADPADRLILATAQQLGLRLVSKDDQIARYPGVEIVW